MKNLPEVITFRITSKCNYNCKYCLSPKKIEELELDSLSKIFELLFKNGAKAIVLTGGEPTIRKDFIEIIKEIKKNNLKIFLDTNGSFFFKYKKVIDENVEVLGLPMDFSNWSYRDKGQMETILKILEYYKNKEEKPIIRIGTVVTKENYKELNKIAELLRKYSIDIWKIYEFLPQNINAINNKASLQISPEDFEQVTREIKEKFSDFFKITISKRKNRNKAYFFINPDGTVFMPLDNPDICKEEIIGNIFDEEIVEKWEKFISKENYLQNIRDTFDKSL